MSEQTKKQPTVKELAISVDSLANSVKALTNIVYNQQKVLDTAMVAPSDDGHEEYDLEGNGEDIPEDKAMPYKMDSSGEAKLELVKLAFNTPDNKLPEMTETPRMLITPTVFEESMIEYEQRLVKDETPDLMEIFIRRRDKRMKSLGRQGILEALAFNRIQEEKERINEGDVLGT